MADPSLLGQIKDYANRVDPYPLYAQLRQTGILRQDDVGEGGGASGDEARSVWVAASHDAITRLQNDPRLSVETQPPTKRPTVGNPITDYLVNPIKDRITDRHQPFLFRDPPAHDVLRAATVQQFTPERVHAMRIRSERLVAEMLDRKVGAQEIDVVEDLAYPLPVAVICELFGVPVGDEARFHDWSSQLATAVEPGVAVSEETRMENARAFDAISDYLADLIAEKRRRPRDDLLSGLANQATADGYRMGDFDLISTAILILVAGHETAVNLIANAWLTLLRHPRELERLRADPGRAVRVIEEVMRYDPPVQLVSRKTLSAIDIAGTTIPEGEALILMLAAGNRDPAAFTDPDRFDPDRIGTRHLGFGGGMHYCVGAPLGRFEAEAALTALARRLKAPRLIEDPPPYRRPATLRGPERLLVAVERIL
ncbi:MULTISPECIES: cytochrome P450 [unclassified Methylobacterium]|uniref:cytochrome P450 n=1 Tax=unclassified Methylobacterium TaxID=2615210 RepID=UPI0011C1F7A3|nr:MULTISPECIES: cytochrome P450 [unclassified Methylobacterium]MCJ2118764.1 cytochrome P450 [Methylobacterium sp. J-001]QEE41692.1 cytochrome P450 [Methylobacterium sp. WL1]TXN01100.1 cytochrome P450 [Methylobacterium sp. WL64]TXN55405.1 cytochrome P450 [Methylobacterium sp. WL2]